MMAEFMGYEYIPSNNSEGYSAGWWHKYTPDVMKRYSSSHKLQSAYFLCRNHNQLPYSSDMNHLMKVAKKLGMSNMSTDFDTAYSVVYNALINHQEVVE